MIVIPVLVLFWIACGALSVGVGMGYWKREYPQSWPNYYYQDLIFEILLALMVAPIALIINFTFQGNYGKYGLVYRRFTKKDKLRLVEQKLDKE
jgi:hypothetical protein